MRIVNQSIVAGSTWMCFILVAAGFPFLAQIRSFFVQNSLNFRSRIQILKFAFCPEFSEKILKIQISPVSFRGGIFCKTKSETLVVMGRVKVTARVHQPVLSSA